MTGECGLAGGRKTDSACGSTRCGRRNTGVTRDTGVRAQLAAEGPSDRRPDLLELREVGPRPIASRTFRVAGGTSIGGLSVTSRRGAPSTRTDRDEASRSPAGSRASSGTAEGSPVGDVDLEIRRSSPLELVEGRLEVVRPQDASGEATPPRRFPSSRGSSHGRAEDLEGPRRPPPFRDVRPFRGGPWPGWTCAVSIVGHVGGRETHGSPVSSKAIRRRTLMARRLRVGAELSVHDARDSPA